MGRKSNAFNNWREFAQTDWLELNRFVLRKYGSRAWTDVQAQFAKRMSISKNTLELLTTIGVGKLQDAALGSLSTAITVGDFFAKVGGHIYVAGANQFYGRTRFNPHFLLKQPVFSKKWVYHSGAVDEYVDFMLYWYPKDLDAGFHGFRYGSLNATQGTPPLPRLK